MPAALKRKVPRLVETAPEIPADRLALHAAIEKKREADDAIVRQQEAIAKARELVYSDRADEEMERLRKAVAIAEESDTRRAASNLKNDKGAVAVGWSAEQARRAVQIAEEQREMTRRGLERLKSDLADLEDDAASALNAVIVEIRKLTVPLVQKLIAELREHKRRSVIAKTILGALLDDDDGRRTIRFNNSLRSMKADDARAAPLKASVVEVEHLQFGQADADYTVAGAAVRTVKTALAALQSDALAKLPELPL